MTRTRVPGPTVPRGTISAPKPPMQIANTTGASVFHGQLPPPRIDLATTRVLPDPPEPITRLPPPRIDLATMRVLPDLPEPITRLPPPRIDLATMRVLPDRPEPITQLLPSRIDLGTGRVLPDAPVNPSQAALRPEPQTASTTLPYREEMELAFRTSFAGVATHLGERGALARFGARAAAWSETVAFASPTPERDVVAHELAHIEQLRRADGVAPDRAADSDHPAEREAAQISAALRAGASSVRATAAPGGAVAFDRSPARATATDPLRRARDNKESAQEAVALPQRDPEYIDNVIERIGCALIAADRYALHWKGGHRLIPNDDIDWTKSSKSLPVLDVQDSPAAARAKAAEWNDVATKTSHDRAVAFYREPGGAILPTWFSPETAPLTYELIMGVNHKVRAQARDIEQTSRSLRDGLVIGMIAGGILRFFVRVLPGGGRVTPEGIPKGKWPTEPVKAKGVNTPEATSTEPALRRVKVSKIDRSTSTAASRGTAPLEVAPGQIETQPPVQERPTRAVAPEKSQQPPGRLGRPASRPEAPHDWKGTLNEFGTRLRWPARSAKSPSTPGANEIPIEQVNLDEVRAMGVDETWARQQARVYREIAGSEIGVRNPSARPRSQWLERLADRLRDADVPSPTTLQSPNKP